jgi:hypothetical protein
MVEAFTILPLALALAVGPARADTQNVLGTRFDVRDPVPTNPTRRTIQVTANEGPDALIPLRGDPTIAGATLRVIARGGGADYDETYDLPAIGWKSTFTRHDWPVYKGFIYGNTDTGGPVMKIIIRSSGWSSPEGTPPPEEPAPGYFRVKVRLTGSGGSIGVRPPDPGTDGGIILTMGGGDSYCVAFGGAANGTVLTNTSARFAVYYPTAAGCPGDVAPPTTTTTTTTPVSTTTSTTVP